MGAGASSAKVHHEKRNGLPKKSKKPPKATSANKTPIVFITDKLKRKRNDENKDEYEKLLNDAPKWTKYPPKKNLEKEKGKIIEFSMRLSADTYGFEKRNILRNEMLSPWHPKRQAMRVDLPHPSLKLFEVSSASNNSTQPASTTLTTSVEEDLDHAVGLKYLKSNHDAELEEDDLNDPNSKLRLAVIDWINTRYRKEIKADKGRLLSEQEVKDFIRKKRITYRSLFYWNPENTAKSLNYDWKGRPITPYPCGNQISICDRGFYFFYGENLAVDCLVTVEHQGKLYCMLIHRTDPKAEARPAMAVTAQTSPQHDSDEEPPGYEEQGNNQPYHRITEGDHTTHNNPLSGAGANNHAGSNNHDTQTNTPSKDRRRSSVTSYFSSTKTAQPSRKTVAPGSRRRSLGTLSTRTYQVVRHITGADKPELKSFEDGAPREVMLAGGMVDIDENEGLGKASRAFVEETGCELDFVKLRADDMIKQVSYGIVQGEARTTRNAWTMSQFVHIHFPNLNTLSTYLLRPVSAPSTGAGGSIQPLFLDVRYVLNRHVVDGCEGKMFASHGKMFLEAILKFVTNDLYNGSGAAELGMDMNRKKLFDVSGDQSYLEYESSRLHLKKQLDDLHLLGN